MSRHSGSTLTPRQREWLDRLRSVHHCASRGQACAQLECRPGTLRQWIRFFTEDLSWPPSIPKHYDAMKISAPPGYRWKNVADAAGEDAASQLRAAVAKWRDVTGRDLDVLARASGLTMARLETLLGGGDISENGARQLRKALSGTKIWAPPEDLDIHRRREEVTKAREEREMGLLLEEQRKYGLKRVGVPLSRMIA